MMVRCPPSAPPRTQHRSLDQTAISSMVALCACWGVQQVTTKIALAGGLPPMFQAAVRSIVATLLLLTWVAVRRGGVRGLFVRDGTLWPGLLVAGLFAAEFVFLFAGVARTSASRSVVFLFSAPFFTAVGAHLLLPSERLNLVRVVGLIVAFGGVVAAAWDRPANGASWEGDLLVMGAAASLGAITVALKASKALARASAEKVFLWQVAGSIVPLAAATLVSGQADWPDASGGAWLALGYQAVVVTFASYLAWFSLVGRYPAGRLSAFTFATPIVGIAAAGAVLGDPVTVNLVLGLVGVGLGLVLVNRS